MREKIRARLPMMTADQAREHVRDPLAFLIRHQVDQGAPRMRAYERVAAQIGRTPAWVQRVLGRRPDAAIGLHDALNIRTAYERLCARVEAAADRVEAENNTLREALDVALAQRDAPRRGAAGEGVAAAAPAGGADRRPAAGALARSPVGTAQTPRIRTEVNDLPLWRASEGD